MKILLALCFLLLMQHAAQGQITVPANFECPPKTSDRHDFTGDGVSLATHTVPPAMDAENGYRLALELEFGFAFKHTKDHLYVGSGHRKKVYYFVIASPDKDRLLVMYADANSSAFRQYSKWVINQARQAIIMKRDFYFVDSTGGKCE